MIETVGDPRKELHTEIAHESARILPNILNLSLTPAEYLRSPHTKYEFTKMMQFEDSRIYLANKYNSLHRMRDEINSHKSVCFRWDVDHIVDNRYPREAM